VTTSGGHNHGQGLFAAFAPYLSYEVNKRQLEISKFVQEKQSNYLKDVFEGNFRDIWREIKKESPTNKVNQDEDALDSIDKHERHSESDNDIVRAITTEITREAPNWMLMSYHAQRRHNDG
jgi:hypothetical protein